MQPIREDIHPTAYFRRSICRYTNHTITSIRFWYGKIPPPIPGVEQPVPGVQQSIEYRATSRMSILYSNRMSIVLTLPTRPLCRREGAFPHSRSPLTSPGTPRADVYRGRGTAVGPWGIRWCSEDPMLSGALLNGDHFGDSKRRH